MLERIRRWLQASPPPPSDENVRLIQMGQYRARLYDLSTSVNSAGETLHQLNTFEERFQQLRKLRESTLEPTELLAKRLSAVQKELEGVVLARYRRICNYLELNAKAVNKKAATSLEKLTALNQQSLQQLEEAIDLLICISDESEPHSVGHDLDRINTVLKKIVDGG